MATVPVGISNRHVHLSLEHISILFGQGYTLTVAKELSQPEQFASGETVKLVGPKGIIDRVRVLGPARSATQVEISVTDSYKLGIEAPVRDSGDLNGTPGLTIIGPHGTVHLEQGAIIAARHLHMTPADAEKFGLKNNDRISVRVPGSRGGIFDQVLVRVSGNFILDMHVDTDEGNAFGLSNEQEVQLLLKVD